MVLTRLSTVPILIGIEGIVIQIMNRAPLRSMAVSRDPNPSFIVHGRRSPLGNVPAVVVLEEQPNPCMGQQRTLVILAPSLLSTVPILPRIGEITT
jgi:hypothetical protein